MLIESCFEFIGLGLGGHEFYDVMDLARERTYYAY